MVFQPTQFGKYYLTRRIAVGGMAEIFLAKLYGVGGFEKPMVVKQILPQYSRNAEFINMFIDEAKIAVTLTHGNIVPVYELGRIGDIYFIAMEYVPGKDLAEILEKARAKNKPISPEHAVYIAIEICKGLDYAHRRTGDDRQSLGVIHRDISPPNVLVSMEGQIKITDFGIAKATYKLGTTEAGVVKGTFGYMSPEQVRSMPVDHRTDIFSSGILLHEMLTGRRLFVGKNELEAVERVKEAQIPAPSAINPHVPGALDPIVFKALAKDASERYASANEFQLALSRFLFTSGTGATATTLAQYMSELFADEAQDKPAEEEIMYSALSAPAPPALKPLPRSHLDDDTHSYAVRPELEATEITEPLDMSDEYTPSMPAAEVARHVAQSAPGRASDAGAGKDKAFGATLALPALADVRTEETEEPGYEDEAPTAIYAGSAGPKQPLVPELRFPPQRKPGRPDESKPSTLPSIPSIKKKPSSRDFDGLTEDFPSANELANLADQLEDATTQPRVLPGQPAPERPELVPPVSRPEEAFLAADTETGPPPEPVTDPQPLSPEPGFLPVESEPEQPEFIPSEPELVLSEPEPLPPVPEHTAKPPAAQLPPAVHKVSRDSRQRISGVITGTLRLFVEGLDDEQEEVPVHDSIPGQETLPSDASAALEIPRTIRPTTLGWIIIGLVVVGAALFVLYKKTDLFSGGTVDRGGETLRPEDTKAIKQPEPEQRLGTIQLASDPAGASFLLYAGETPVTLSGLDTGRSHLLRVERDGFQGVFKTVTPEDFKQGVAEVQLTLEPMVSRTSETPPQLDLQPRGGKPGTLVVNSDPPKAMVWHLVPGEMKGVTIGKSYYFKALLSGHRPGFVRVTAVDFKEAETFATTVKLEPETADGGPQPAAPDAAPEPKATPPQPKPRPRPRPRPRTRPRPRPRPRTRPRPRPRPRPKKGGKPKLTTPDWAK